MKYNSQGRYLLSHTKLSEPKAPKKVHTFNKKVSAYLIDTLKTHINQGNMQSTLLLIVNTYFLCQTFRTKGPNLRQYGNRFKPRIIGCNCGRSARTGSDWRYSSWFN